MERCPNCGSTVRAGAKFCTTCGMRLPEAPATDESAPAASGSGKGSPFDSTASLSGSRWPSSASGSGNNDAASGYAVSGTDTGADTNSTAEPAAPDTSDEEQHAESAPAPAEESGPAWASSSSSSGWNWGSQPSAGESDQTEAAETEPAPAADSGTTTTGEAPEPEAAETEGALPPTATADTETAVQVADTGPTETGIIEETVYQTPESAVVSTASAESSTQEPSGEVQSDESETAGAWYAPPATTGSPEPAPTSGASVDLDRANQLLDDLRDLLPHLASMNQSASGSDIVSILENATASDAQQASFEELRTAVSAAQQRPRDIDTMLDISNRLDVIASLEDAYQELSSAVEKVLSQMSNGE